MRMTSIKMVLLTVMVLSRLIMADQSEDMRAPRPDALSYPGSTPAIVSPFDSAGLEQFQQCVCQLKSIIESGFDYVESQLDYVELQLDYVGSQLDVLLGCASTPITSPIVISVPGSYCLAHDITGVIEIAVSGVALSLNEFQISGSIIIDADLQNISISGGAIDPNLLSDGLTIGDGCENIRISNVVIRNGVNGLNAAGVLGNPITSLVISRVAADSCSGDGIVLTECVAELTGCIASNNNDGIVCSGSSSIVTIADSSAYNNSRGFYISDGTYNCINSVAELNERSGFEIGAGNIMDTTSVICEDCYAISNGLVTTPNGYGFYIAYHCHSGIVHNCIAIGNPFGFLAQGGSDIEWTNCIAKGNTINGFFVNTLNTLGTFITGLISNSIAIENGNTGFNVRALSLSAVRFISNYAVDNQYIVGGKNVNYGTASGTSGGGNATNPNTAPYYWLYWNNESASPFNNVDGNNV